MRAEFFMQSHKWKPRHGRYALRKHLPRAAVSLLLEYLRSPRPTPTPIVYIRGNVVVHWLHVPLRKCAVWIPPTAALQRCILWASCARHGTGADLVAQVHSTVVDKGGGRGGKSFPPIVFSFNWPGLREQPFESLSGILGYGAPGFSN